MPKIPGITFTPGINCTNLSPEKTCEVSIILDTANLIAKNSGWNGGVSCGSVPFPLNSIITSTRSFSSQMAYGFAVHSGN